MRKIYFLLVLALLSNAIIAQDQYDFCIIHMSGYNFKIVATPNFTSSGNTNVSDVGFTLTLPAGTVDVSGLTSMLGSGWNVTEYEGSVILGFGIGDGTKDVFNIKRDPGSTMISHNSGEQIDLVSFDITSSPVTGTMEFLDNSDPIATHPAWSGGLNSFYNSNIDNTTPDDYFMGYTSGMESFNFSSLSTDDLTIASANISIYPNPTKGRLNIETNKTISYSIYNILGQSVKLAGELNADTQRTINLSHLPDGIYILKAYDDNKNSKSFKIIKKE